MCQHVNVQLTDSAGKPIDLFNLHSPSSAKRPLNATVREQIQDLPSLEAVFKICPNITYCYQKDHQHGDLVVAKGLPAAESVACEAKATSDAHQMCAVMLPCKMRPRSGAVLPVEASASAAKPAETSASAAQPVETSATAAKPAE